MELPKIELDRSEWGDIVDVIHPDISWDKEQEREAVREAQRLAERDPEAASLLMAHVAVSQETRHTAEEDPFEDVYNPTRLYAQMTKYYRISPKELDEMHYLLFFGYLREAQQMNEEEKRQTDSYMQRHSVPSSVRMVD